MSWSRYHVKIKRNSFGGPGYDIIFQKQLETYVSRKYVSIIPVYPSFKANIYDVLWGLILQCPHVFMCGWGGEGGGDGGTQELSYVN